MADITRVLNTIRSYASEDYQNLVPEATIDNIENVSTPILQYSSLQNEFLTALVNRIGLVLIRNKTYKNPLNVLKNGKKPLGSDIEEIFAQMAESTDFDSSGKNLLSRKTPDIKALYHRMNRQSTYKVTISQAQLQKAFTTYSEMESLIETIVNTLYSGDNRDEFELAKGIFSQAVDEELIKPHVITIKSEATEAEKMTALVKAVKAISSKMTFPSDKYNSYPVDTVTGKGITTWTPRDDQIIIASADTMAAIDVDVLAKAFNMEKAAFLPKVLEVDELAEGVALILCDKSYPLIIDNLYQTSSFYNAEGLYTNFYLHHWQTYSLSLFANAVLFAFEEEEEEEETTPQEPTPQELVEAEATRVYSLHIGELGFTFPAGTPATDEGISAAMTTILNSEVSPLYEIIVSNVTASEVTLNATISCRLISDTTITSINAYSFTSLSYTIETE